MAGHLKTKFPLLRRPVDVGIFSGSKRFVGPKMEIWDPINLVVFIFILVREEVCRWLSYERAEHQGYKSSNVLCASNITFQVGRNWRDNVNARRANSFRVEKFLKKVGLGKEDHYFWKQIGKGLLCTYALWGMVWLWNETSPLGWWTLMPKPKEEKELAHLYERIRYPYPGDKEAMDEFVAKGGMIGTAIGPKGFVENEKDFVNIQKELQDKKFEQEAMKLWLRMKSEVISELQEKGFEVE